MLDCIFWIGVIRVGIFWVVIILGGNFPGGNCLGESYPGLKFSEWELSGWELSWAGFFQGGNFPGGNCSVGIIRLAIFWVGVFLVPNNLNVFKKILMIKLKSYSKYHCTKDEVLEIADLVTFIEEILNGKLHFFVQYKFS